MLIKNKINIGIIIMNRVRGKSHFNVTIHRGEGISESSIKINIITDADANISFDNSEILDYQTISYD